MFVLFDVSVPGFAVSFQGSAASLPGPAISLLGFEPTPSRSLQIPY